MVWEMLIKLAIQEPSQPLSDLQLMEFMLVRQALPPQLLAAIAQLIIRAQLTAILTAFIIKIITPKLPIRAL